MKTWQTLLFIALTNDDKIPGNMMQENDKLLEKIELNFYHDSLSL